MPSRRAFLGAATRLAGAVAAGTLGAESRDAVPAPSPVGGAVPESRPSAPPPAEARARVLGIAQDGGLPQLDCRRACCVAARRDPSRGRRVASLGIFGPSPGSVTLVDATPDIRSQIAELRESAGTEAAPGIPADRILLTHAHTGHYTGLIHLGRESMAARGAPVLATSRMRAFLESNKPWSRLVEWGHIALRTLEPGGRVDLASPRSGPPGSVAPGISVEAISVPHRGEDSDTVGFIFRGPRRRLLYVPDTNAWATWPRPLESYLAEVDVALLDGTFFDGSELPGRDLREIPHPFITATMEILGKRAGSGRCRVLFTHLNHTNPALDADSGEAARVRDSGFEIAREGMEFAL